jgi:hypothetical protein
MTDDVAKHKAHRGVAANLVSVAKVDLGCWDELVNSHGEQRSGRARLVGMQAHGDLDPAAGGRSRERGRRGPRQLRRAEPGARPGRLTGRHWRLVSLLGEHGVLSTNQVVVLLFGSRPTAHRHLADLHRAGLVEQFVFARDRAHLLHHRLTPPGVGALSARLESAGRPVPYGLAHRGQQVDDVLRVNQFFTDLVAASATTEGHLYRWWHGLDAAAWLRTHQVDTAACDGFGLWIEQDSIVRFLFYLDPAPVEPAGFDGRPAPPSLDEPPLWAILRTCENANAGLPVDAITILTEREDALREMLNPLERPVPIATTTPVLLAASGTGPAGPVWRTGPTPARRRLIDLSANRPSPPDAAGVDTSRGGAAGRQGESSIVSGDEPPTNWPGGR